MEFIVELEEAQKKAFEQILRGLESGGVIKSYREYLPKRDGSLSDDFFQDFREKPKAEELSHYMKEQYRDLVD